MSDFPGDFPLCGRPEFPRVFPFTTLTRTPPDYCDGAYSSSRDDVYTYTHESSQYKYSITDANALDAGGALAMEPSDGKLSLTNKQGG